MVYSNGAKFFPNDGMHKSQIYITVWLNVSAGHCLLPVMSSTIIVQVFKMTAQKNKGRF